MTGGAWRLTRDTLRALARALRLGGWEPRLSQQQVDKVLERWIELLHFGGGPGGADVRQLARGAAGWLDWAATVSEHVWREPSECVPLRDSRLCIVEWQPAVYLVAMLRWYKEPALRASGSNGALAYAQQERTALETTRQYKRAMSRLGKEFARCPREFLRVALGDGLDKQPAEGR